MMNRNTAIVLEICTLAWAAALVMLTTASASVLAEDRAEQPPLKVLLLSGRNNHDWKATTPLLKEILEHSGRFAVDVTADPSRLDSAMLKRYDVVVSNWSGFPEMDKRQWGEKAEKAFVDFIRDGKGFALFHAASATLRTWPEFQQLIGATWGESTGHGPIHTFQVSVVDASQPVTSGMTPFYITDELWHRMQAHPDRHVLCTAFSSADRGGSGRDEPVVLCTELGKGRGFNLVLGHDVRAMQNAAWQTLMLRGVEWAATGKVTIPLPASWPSSAALATIGQADVEAALKGIAGYTVGDSREGLQVVEHLVFASAADAGLRKKLATAVRVRLTSGATTDCKRFLCGQLSLVGSEEDVRALAALLNDKDLSLAARSALARIPGQAPLAAMRGELPATKGTVLIGLINTLGRRRDTRAVDAVARYLTSGNPAVVAASIDALGNIGSVGAAKALLTSKDRLSKELRMALADALLQCAEKLPAAGEKGLAATIYEDLSASTQPRHIRMAAFPGLVASRADRASLLRNALTGNDPALQSAAIRCARRSGDRSVTAVLADQLPRLSGDIRLQLLNALADRGDPAALDAVMAACDSEDTATRLAAIRALGRLGNARTVRYITGLAAGSRGAEQQAARGALAALRGNGVEAELIRAVAQGKPSSRREAIHAVRGRRLVAAVPALLKSAEDADSAVVRASLKAVGELGAAADIQALLGILKKAPPETIQSDVESALVAIARRTDNVRQTTSALAEALPGADSSLRCSLIRLLGRFGGDASLAAVRNAVKDKDETVRTAAVRTLADWPDVSALEGLLTVARSADSATLKILALRGLGRLAMQAKDTPPEKITSVLVEALKLAERPEEKRALLAALGGVPGVGAMQLAVSCLGDEALVDEAGLAAVQVAEAIWRYHRSEAREAMRKVAAACKAGAATERATSLLAAMSKPVNLAIGAKASSPDGLEKDGDAGGDRAAIDGNPGTYWDEVDGKDLYRLRVELKAPVTVSSISIVGWRHHEFSPKDFDILCDGKVVKAVRGDVYDNNRLIVSFPAARCKVLELKITGRYGPSPAIRELEIYHVDPSKD